MVRKQFLYLQVNFFFFSYSARIEDDRKDKTDSVSIITDKTRQFSSPNQSVDNIAKYLILN